MLYEYPVADSLNHHLVQRVPHIEDVMSCIITPNNFWEYFLDTNSRMETMLTSFGTIVLKRPVRSNTLIAQLGKCSTEDLKVTGSIHC